MNEVLAELESLANIQNFEDRIQDESVKYTADHIDVLQINVGRLCNLACKHCHLEAGPSRTEIMHRDVMEACLQVCKEQNIPTIDITGGAPEMNPNFRWFVTEATKICSHVIVRTNLVILANPGYEDLPAFYADKKVEVVCSLPYYSEGVMDKVRGKGAFNTTIGIIQKLNSLGYGKNEELVLNMVYNPAGAFFRLHKLPSKKSIR